MTSWHLLTDPSFPRWLAFPVIQGFNFVAEGFVLLAGVSVGVGIAWKPDGTLRGRYYLRRGLQLLGIHYVVAAALLAGFGVPDEPKGFATRSLSEKTIAVLTLEYQPYLGDILSVFVFLFLATPVFLKIQRAYGGWAMLAVSTVFYLVANTMALAAPGGWQRALELNRGGAFDFNTWQLVFVCGIFLGMNYRGAIAQPARFYRRWLLAASVAFLLIAGCYLAILLSPNLTKATKALLINRHPLTPLRALYVGLMMLVVGLATIHRWPRLSGTRSVKTIVVFGRHSLTAFVASVFLDYALKTIIWRFDLSFPVNLVTWILELWLMYVLVLWLDRPTTMDMAGSGNG